MFYFLIVWLIMDICFNDLVISNFHFYSAASDLVKDQLQWPSYLSAHLVECIEKESVTTNPEVMESSEIKYDNDGNNKMKIQLVFFFVFNIYVAANILLSDISLWKQFIL